MSRAEPSTYAERSTTSVFFCSAGLPRGSLIPMDMQHTLRDIAQRVGGTVVSGGEVRVSGLARLNQAEPGQLSYVTARRYLAQADESLAAALLAPPGLATSKPTISVPNPLLAYARLLAWWYPPAAPPAGIQPGAWVDEQAQVHSSATVMPTAYVGPHAEIGPRCLIYPGVVVGAAARLGAGTVLYANVTLYDGVRIGAKVIIHGGSVIGADGFGYVVDDDGTHMKILQRGSVVIEDDVEIGANVCIDRATQGETRIGRGTKIDNQVQIGHNVTVGSHSILVAQVGISGSCRLGHHVMLGGQTGVRDHVTIGDGVQAAVRTGIVHDIEPESQIAGAPAMPYKAWLQVAQITPRLPEMRRRLRNLERRLRNLERRGGARESSGHA